MLVVTRCRDKSRDEPPKITSWRPSSWQPSWEQPSSSRLSWPWEESLSSLRVATALPPEPGEVKLQRCCHAEPNPTARQPWRANASLLSLHTPPGTLFVTSQCFVFRSTCHELESLGMLLMQKRVPCLPVRFHSTNAFPAAMVSNSPKCASTFWRFSTLFPQMVTALQSGQTLARDALTSGGVVEHLHRDPSVVLRLLQRGQDRTKIGDTHSGTEHV